MFRSLRKIARGKASRKVRRSTLSIEALEVREVPALWLDADGTLVYDGMQNVLRDDVSVSQSSDGGITVRYKYSESLFFSFYRDETYSPGEVTSIWFDGGEGHDKFTNNTALRSVAHGRNGSDTLIGGSSRDSLFGEAGADSLAGGGGRDKLFGDGGADTLAGGASGDTLIGGSEADRLLGGTGNDSLDGSDGNDRLSGEAGNDTLAGHNGADTLQGNEDNDSLVGEAGADKLSGGSGADTLQGGADDDTLTGGSGNDSVSGDSGNDRLYGDYGLETYSLGDNDTLRGGEGADSLYGEGGTDALFGDRGNDSLHGGYGNDMLFGGVLDNLHTIIGGGDYDENGRDLLDSGPGFDRMLLDDRDAIFNATGDDAAINFRHGSGKWTNSQIERVDAAFAILHNSTANTKLLKRSSGERMAFRRDSGTAAGFNDDGTIVVTDLVMNGSSPWEPGYILHEIGHNWDGESPIWSRFIAISGWTKSNKDSDPAYTRIRKYGETWWHLTASEQASSYAMTHPLDDFGESFAAYFLQRAGLGWYDPSDGTGAAAIPNKIALIDGWVDTL